MNKFILQGRLTKEPETKYTQNSNKLVCAVSIAVDRRFGEKKTDFFNLIAWEKTGEFISKYFSKGQQILVSGRIENTVWTDDQGKNHYSTNFIVEEAYFCGNKTKEDLGGEEQIEDFIPSEADDSLPF